MTEETYLVDRNSDFPTFFDSMVQQEDSSQSSFFMPVSVDMTRYEKIQSVSDFKNYLAKVKETSTNRVSDVNLQDLLINSTFVGEYHPAEGLPLQVFNDKYALKNADNSYQTWPERTREVALGNMLLGNMAPNAMFHNKHNQFEALKLAEYMARGLMPSAGRHLQNGGPFQGHFNAERVLNCTTSLFNFLTAYLLLNTCGVGSSYSSYVRRTNYAEHMPHIRLVLDGGDGDYGDVSTGAHPDFRNVIDEFSGFMDTKRIAQRKYPSEDDDVRWFTIGDSREGWCEALAAIETATFHQKHKDKLFIFDFSNIRANGTPIAGYNNRPASGPLPLMRAFGKISTLRGLKKMAPWEQAMIVDHHMAHCIVNGGVRRSARIGTKWWKDSDIFRFIEIKRGGFLESANNSVVVDDEFVRDLDDPRSHAFRVFQSITAAQFYDKSGEPGFQYVSKMNTNVDGVAEMKISDYINTEKKKVTILGKTKDVGIEFNWHPKTLDMMSTMLDFVKKLPKEQQYGLNPCGEIPLHILGGYCNLFDICGKYVKTEDELKIAAHLATRFAIRVNLMWSLYQGEVNRTNRIGICITAWHELAYNLFKINFYDLVNADNIVSPHRKLNKENIKKAKQFWKLVDEIRQIVEDEAKAYSKALGVKTPVTMTSCKPSGTVSKVMDCTEGAHLPTMAYYMRWKMIPKYDSVVTDNGSTELVESALQKEYREKGYPIKDVSATYQNTVVVGFPIRHSIVDVLGDDVVCAEETTPDEQFEFVRLIEKYWFSTESDGTPKNSQVSYTMKWRPEEFTYQTYMDMIKKNQFSVRVMSVMPYVDMTQYAYQPEEPLSPQDYQEWVSKIERSKQMEALYSDADFACENGVCAIDMSR